MRQNNDAGREIRRDRVRNKKKVTEEYNIQDTFIEYARRKYWSRRLCRMSNERLVEAARDGDSDHSYNGGKLDVCILKWSEPQVTTVT